MAKKSALAAYQAKRDEIKALEAEAAQEMRDEAASHVDALKQLARDYEDLTGKALPELAKLGGSSGSTSSRGRAGRNGSAKRVRRGLSGAYEGMTIPEAIIAVLKKSKKPMGPADLADAIGANKNSLSVALSGMMKDKLVKRKGRGEYMAG
ncbi:MAG: hypothetical protein AAGD00_05320 [Planctomycetota bacterium]